MKLVDANLLLYAIDSSSPRHRLARRWVESALSGTETVALPWSVLLAVVRISTRPSVFARPLSVAAALDYVDEWLAQPGVVVPQPTDRHAALLRELLAPLGTGGNVTMEAHLAALAVEHGATLFSTDANFSRFPGLRWRNPL